MKKYKVVNYKRFNTFIAICFVALVALLAWVGTWGCEYAFEQVMKL